MNRIFLFAALFIGASGLSACAGKSAPDISSMPEPGGAQARNDADYDAEGNYIGPGSQAHLRRFAGSDRVFFDFDSHALDDADRETLGKHAAWLTQNAAVSVMIEGHCDERGTRDYNIALGERRANAAKNYLAGLGVSPSRMRVVSYGKERPEALGSDEAAYAQNRRAVTMVLR